jgi:hypothetical protein
VPYRNFSLFPIAIAAAFAGEWKSATGERMLA